MQSAAGGDRLYEEAGGAVRRPGFLTRREMSGVCQADRDIRGTDLGGGCKVNLTVHKARLGATLGARQNPPVGDALEVAADAIGCLLMNHAVRIQMQPAP